MNKRSARQLLIGRQIGRTKQWLGLAIVLFLGSLWWFARVKALDFPDYHDLMWWEGYTILLLGLIIIQSVHNGGILISWTIAFGAVAGMVLNYWGIAIVGDFTIFDFIQTVILFGTAAAATMGTLGFILGAIIRHGAHQLPWQATRK